MQKMCFTTILIKFTIYAKNVAALRGDACGANDTVNLAYLDTSGHVFGIFKKFFFFAEIFFFGKKMNHHTMIYNFFFFLGIFWISARHFVDLDVLIPNIYILTLYRQWFGLFFDDRPQTHRRTSRL